MVRRPNGEIEEIRLLGRADLAPEIPHFPTMDPLRIVFFGESIFPFGEGLGDRLPFATEIHLLKAPLRTDADYAHFTAADVLVSFDLNATMPSPPGLRLLQIPGTGYDNIDQSRLPAAAHLCNCFGHDQAMAEYVFAAILHAQIPLAESDRFLRTGDWRYGGGRPLIHDEIADQTIGLLGFGHIGQAIATRAKAFEMTVHVANRSAVPASATVDRYFSLDDLTAFYASADVVVASLPHVPATDKLINAAAFAAMRSTAQFINVGRGAIVDEEALYHALRTGQIRHAVIDTWYQYPSASTPTVLPSSLPFHELTNVLMTPHMSAWTRGTVRKRRDAVADNITRLVRGEPLQNIVRGPTEAR